MKAILNQDIITTISEDHGTVEIGNIPAEKKGKTSLGQLRFNGKKIVDLMDLKYIWVKYLGGRSFELHAIEVPGSQRVKMSYSDRSQLILDENTIRIRTLEEVEQARKLDEKRMAKNRLRSKFKGVVGEQGDQLATIAKLTYLLIMALDDNSGLARDLLDQLRADIEETYSISKMQSELPKLVGETKSLMQDYYDEAAKIDDVE